jgi:Redoxin
MPRALACRIRASRLAAVLFAFLLALTASAQVTDLRGNPVDPLLDRAKARVLLFVRTDCPITNRYAPELRRIAQHFAQSPVDFFLVYSGTSETASVVQEHLRQYMFPGTALLDPRHELAQRSHATTAPEAAVFDRTGTLLYLGRIDDRWISFGRSRPQPTVHDLEAAISAVLAGKEPEPQRTRAIGCSLGDVR